MESIYYKKGYKYQLAQTYSLKIAIAPESEIYSPSNFIQLSADGVLTISKHYAWDGPSGPTIDTPNFMRGSLVHDALYQLMREGLLNSSQYRQEADRLLQTICKEDGMSTVRAWWVYQGLRFGGKSASKIDNIKQIINAPK